MRWNILSVKFTLNMILRSACYHVVVEGLRIKYLFINKWAFCAIQFLATSNSHEALLLVEEQMFWLDCSHLASQSWSNILDHEPTNYWLTDWLRINIYIYKNHFTAQWEVDHCWVDNYCEWKVFCKLFRLFTAHTYIM